MVPATIAGALVVLALAGSFGGIGAIGQAFSGPTVPLAASGAANAGSSATGAASLTRVLATVGPLLATPTVGLAAVTPARPGPAGRLGAGGAPATSQGQGGFSPVGAGGPGSSGGSAPPSGHPAPSSPAPTVADGVVKTATSVTKQIPGPIGAAGTNTLQSLGSALNKIAPLRLRSGR